MKRVAVIEDNADNRLLLQALLDGRYDLTEYENGPEGIQGIRSAPPDAVLLDISLPGMDGVEVLSRIRREPRLAKLPVIALTAHAMAGDRDRYLAAGFDEYVTKPIVDENVLLSALQRLLEK